MPDSDSNYIHNSHKRYPDGTQVLIEFRKPFKITINPQKPRKKHREPLALYLIRADSRAKTTIKDLIKSNTFDHFITFTFDPAKLPYRYDADMCKVAIQKWFKSQTRKYGRFDYIVLPEFHKNGALHFHAVFGGFKGPLADSGVRHGGNIVYNLPTYRLGFSTAKIIKQSPEDRDRVASYLTKYVTKDMPHFAGKKRYFTSSDLKRPVKTTNWQIDNLGQQLRYIVRRRQLTWENEHCKVYRIPPDENDEKSVGKIDNSLP